MGKRARDGEDKATKHSKKKSKGDKMVDVEMPKRIHMPSFHHAPPRHHHHHHRHRQTEKAKKHSDELNELAEKDPDFYNFLQEHDAGLLDFEDDEDDEDDDLLGDYSDDEMNIMTKVANPNGP